MWDETLGREYIAFAVDHPAHFEVMHHPDLNRTEDPAVVEARDPAKRLMLLHEKGRSGSCLRVLMGEPG